MTSDKLKELINDLSKNEKIKSYDEAATKQVIILQLLKNLGWNIYDIDEVQPEFSTENKRVDYSLKVNNSNKIFIEVKRVGKKLSDYEEQLLRYSFQEGIQLAILTDGIIWNFYLPLQEGNWKNRKIFCLDIFKNDTNLTSKIFSDILSKNNVISSDNIENLKLHSKITNLNEEEKSKNINEKKIIIKINNKQENKQENKIYSDDVLIIPAGFGLEEYNLFGLYICQPNRKFKATKYIGFYKNNRIEKVIPEILGYIENINLKRDKIEINNIFSEEKNKEEIINRLNAIKQKLPNKERYDENHKILVLSLFEDERTKFLPDYILNDKKSEKGKIVAFVQNQTYVSYNKIVKAKNTSELF